MHAAVRDQKCPLNGRELFARRPNHEVPGRVVRERCCDEPGEAELPSLLEETQMLLVHAASAVRHPLAVRVRRRKRHLREVLHADAVQHAELGEGLDERQDCLQEVLFIMVEGIVHEPTDLPVDPLKARCLGRAPKNCAAQGCFEPLLLARRQACVLPADHLVHPARAGTKLPAQSFVDLLAQQRDDFPKPAPFTGLAIRLPTFFNQSGGLRQEPGPPPQQVYSEQNG
mmetsp:Transcript_87115/g.219352  ORF Transcript_87115/g.219352 Transcript_87115/m.219352 type:complete len:228 (-) Transcript_87115:396-1079(-)